MPKIIIMDPRFDELTSWKQRAELNELLRERFGAPPGTIVACRTVHLERRGGVYWANMKAEWERASFVFHVKWLNKGSGMTFSEGWFRRPDEPSEMSLYRSA